LRSGSISFPVVEASGPLESTFPSRSKIVCVWKIRVGARLRPLDF
jgi:hypothetical protein